MPWFSTKYYAICGNCYTIFRITEQGAEEAKVALKNETDAEYNLRSCPKCGSFNSVNDESCGICKGRIH
jgi:recombinational DNA repair protein RecR